MLDQSLDKERMNIMKKNLILVMIVLILGMTGCTKTDTLNSDNEMTTGTEETAKEIGNSRLDRSKLAKDKAIIAELRQAIVMLLVDEAYLGLRTSGIAVVANEEGQINFADLLDTSDEIGQNAVEEIKLYLGLDDSLIQLNSEFKDECSVEIVKMESISGEVVIQLTSESYNIQFYIDAAGDHDGEYK